MADLMLLLAWHGAAITFAAFWTMPLWSRSEAGGWRVIEEK
jgi:hypothetical protein